MLYQNSIRSILAAAGFATGLGVVASPALSQTTPQPTAAGESAQPQVSDVLDQAAAALADGRPVLARTMLLELTARSASLSDRERVRLSQLLTSASNRVKSLSTIEVSLQTADASLSRGDLRTAERHAQAVIDSPKATNEQVASARRVLSSVETLRSDLAPTLDDTLNAVVADFDAGRFAQSKSGLESIVRSGVKLNDSQNDLVLLYQSRIVELEQANGQLLAAGMMQPGVVKRREPAQKPAEPAPAPAEQPAAQPAAAEPAPAVELPAAQPEPAPQPEPAAQPPAQPPADDLIQQARGVEAQSLLTEADVAFDASRMNEAAGKYDRLLRQYSDQLSAEQRTHVTNRLAEARTRLGANVGAEGNVLAQEIEARKIQRERAMAEFSNDMEQARKSLASADTSRARDLAASANLTINSNRQLFNEAEFEDYAGQVRTLLIEIDRAEEANRRAAAEDRTRRIEEEARKNATVAEADRQRKIAEAVQRVRALQKELKYEEALQVTEQILFLDPINPTGMVLRDVIADTIVYRRYLDIQGAKDRSYTHQEVDNQETLIAPPNILDYPSDWPRISYLRGEPIAFQDAEENRRALALLQSKRIPVAFNETSLSNVVSFIGAITQLNIDVDWQSLEQVGIDQETPVTLNLTNVPVETVLNRVVEKVSPDSLNGAAWSINDGVLTIASRELINKNKALVIYDIRDLLIEVPDYDNAPEFDLQAVLQSSGQGGGGQSPFQQNEEEEEEGRTLEERTNDIIEIITTNVDAEGWQENGGDVGFIQQLAGSLIITNTPANHRAIHGLLSKLREVRAMQINVETRFLLVSQDFFEQIGFDIDVYFNAENNQVRAARAQNPTGQIRPSDFFDFTRGGLQRRVGPPPFDSDGDGTIDPQPSNAVALPSPTSVIGAGQNSLGITESILESAFGGDILANAPALGVAGQFLDDVQVDFLVKATQADRRTVALTAPRLTFTNGQTSNIYVATQVAFVSDLEPVVSESAVGFDPELESIPEGVVLTVEGTISADRRYVTLNVDAAVSKIEGFTNTAISAIAGGQLVNSAATQSFVQLPTTTVTQVQTTVTVPDQGTILLGGQRLVTESEVESGVPVLSKIPIINRFFSNRIETKEEQTLLILLKPTILIQNEEEERSFPGLTDQIRMPQGG